MQDLAKTLYDHDPGLLLALGQVWGLPDNVRDADQMVAGLLKLMQDPARAEAVWDKLDDAARGAAQALYSSQKPMAQHQFELIYGKIRKMGRGGIEREQPHRQPANAAEALYYRGIAAEGFMQTPQGIKPVVFIPPELAAVLPVHRTTYSDLEVEEDLPEIDLDDEGEEALSTQIAIDEADLGDIQPADTSIVDDLTTLLAYLRLNGAVIEGESISAVDQRALTPHLLNPDPTRLAFMLAIGASADLITTQEGRAHPKRSGLVSWLDAPRPRQVQVLVEAWRDSSLYLELWHVPDLKPEWDGASYDPRDARQAASDALQQFATSGWTSIDGLIEAIKEADPDFQRPGGDYNSWYIRGQDGEYLRGFASWDAVEGAQLEFILTGPMHWLSLLDTSDEAVRLTAYGRAALGLTPWPDRERAPDDKITVTPEGIFTASRRVSRAERYQLARLSSWAVGEPRYRYRIDAQSIQAAAQQGISTAQIAQFLTRQLDNQPLPQPVAQLLNTWQTGPTAQVDIERLLVLRTFSEETLDQIFNNPATRRYLGARLGPMAVVVLPGQLEGLREALGRQGISAQIPEET